MIMKLDFWNQRGFFFVLAMFLHLITRLCFF